MIVLVFSFAVFRIGLSEHMISIQKSIFDQSKLRGMKNKQKTFDMRHLMADTGNSQTIGSLEMFLLLCDDDHVCPPCVRSENEQKPRQNNIFLFCLDTSNVIEH